MKDIKLEKWKLKHKWQFPYKRGKQIKGITMKTGYLEEDIDELLDNYISNEEHEKMIKKIYNTGIEIGADMLRREIKNLLNNKYLLD